MKKIIILVLALVILTGCKGAPEIVSSYDNAKAYISYLKNAEGDLKLIEGYIDKSADGYLVDIYNGNDVFWIAEVRILDGEDNEIGSYTTTLIAPYSYYFSYDALDGEPVQFIHENDGFYEFSYPDAEVDYELIYDITEDYSEEWYNILLESECTLENVEAAAKYQYAVNVVTDTYYYAYYFYDDTIATYYDAEYEADYPDPLSAVYAAGMDYSAKTITIYQDKGDVWEEMKVISME